MRWGRTAAGERGRPPPAHADAAQEGGEKRYASATWGRPWGGGVERERRRGGAVAAVGRGGGAGALLGRRTTRVGCSSSPIYLNVAVKRESICYLITLTEFSF
jgi:hypothetical protein